MQKASKLRREMKAARIRRACDRQKREDLDRFCETLSLGRLWCQGGTLRVLSKAKFASLGLPKTEIVIVGRESQGRGGTKNWSGESGEKT